VDGRSDHLLNLPPHEAILGTIFWVFNLFHDEDGDPALEEFLLDSFDFLAPKIAHQKLRPMLQLFFADFAQEDGVVLEDEVLHLPELEENNGLHVAGFDWPVDLEHGTQLLQFALEQLQFIGLPVPPPEELRPNVVPNKLIPVPDLQNF
jgi:hypothetical protein